MATKIIAIENDMGDQNKQAAYDIFTTPRITWINTNGLHANHGSHYFSVLKNAYTVYHKARVVDRRAYSIVKPCGTIGGVSVFFSICYIEVYK